MSNCTPFYSRTQVSTKYGGQGLAQFLKNGLPMAIGMSFSETSLPTAFRFTGRRNAEIGHYGQTLNRINPGLPNIPGYHFAHLIR